MAIDRRSAGAALQSNLPSAEFLAGPNSGFERGALSEIAFDAQAMALQLGPGERLEPVEVPVLGGVSRVLEEAVVGHGVDRAAGQDLQHVRLKSWTRQGPAEGQVHPAHVVDQAHPAWHIDPQAKEQ